MFGIPWSIGGVLDVDGREKFDKFYREILLGHDEDLPMPKVMGNKLEIPYPESGLVYDYAYEVWNIAAFRVTCTLLPTQINVLNKC